MKYYPHYKPVPSAEYPGWYEIPGYSGYCANKLGHILTKKTRNFSKGGNAGRYLKVAAYRDGSPKSSLYYVHDLVCRAFHGIPNFKAVVLHLDNDRSNNTPNNLQWGTQSDNILQVYRDGLKYSKAYSASLESHTSSGWWGWFSNEDHASIEDYDYVSVNSSNIDTVGYDKKVKSLEILFLSGGTYQYDDVPYRVFKELVHADSVGRYFHHHIKFNYSYTKQ